MSIRLRARWLGGLSAAAAVVAVLAWEPRTSAQSQTPQFRGGVDVVALDFLATGPNGKPVVDLTAREIHHTGDGRSRPLTSLQFVRLSVAASAADRRRGAAPVLAPPFGTNEPSTAGRDLIILVDQEHIRSGEGKAAMDAAARFLDTLAPQDRVGVVTLPNGRVEVDLTTNHARAQKVLGGITGKAMRPSGISNISLNEALTVRDERIDPDKKFTNELIDRECKFAPEDSFCRTRVVQEAMMMVRDVELSTETTLRALREFLSGLSGAETPTTVLFLSGTLVQFEELRQDMEDVARAAARARVQMFVIQPHEPMLDATRRDQPPSMTLDSDRTLTGLRDLAGVTGGDFLRLAGAGDLVFDRIAERISSHYLLGFEPRPGEQDGKPHRINIKTTRPGVSILARPMFIIDDPSRTPQPAFALESLLREAPMRRDLLLRAAAFAFRDVDPRHVKIVVAVEPVEGAATLTSAAFALIEAGGTSAARWSEEGANVVTRPLLTAAAVPPGDYRLRVAAADTLGRRGTVDYEFSARLTELPSVTFGAVMSGREEGGAFRPLLQIPSDAAGVTGFVEVYGTFPSGGVLSVKFEIASSPGGPAVVSGAGSVQGTTEATRFVATGLLPVIALAPGDHEIRATISLNDVPLGRATGVFRRLR